MPVIGQSNDVVPAGFATLAPVRVKSEAKVSVPPEAFTTRLPAKAGLAKRKRRRGSTTMSTTKAQCWKAGFGDWASQDNRADRFTRFPHTNDVRSECYAPLRVIET